MRQAIQEPEGRLLYVPVRSSASGAVTPRTGRLESGERVGLAFTSEAALAATLGGGQRWVVLAGRVVAGMFAAVGVAETRIDALPVAAAAAMAAVGAAAAMAEPAAPVLTLAPVEAQAPVMALGPEPRRARSRVRSARRSVRQHARPSAVRHAY